ncbi:MAG: hypothetical protein ACM3MF_09780, partial [Anaerolineae bacterium]
MLAALILWLFLGLLLYLYGSSGLELLRRWPGGQADEPTELSLVLLCGLIVFTTFASFLSLFMPLGGLALA